MQNFLIKYSASVIDGKKNYSPKISHFNLENKSPDIFK